MSNKHNWGCLQSGHPLLYYTVGGQIIDSHTRFQTSLVASKQFWAFPVLVLQS